MVGEVRRGPPGGSAIGPCAHRWELSSRDRRAGLRPRAKPPQRLRCVGAFWQPDDFARLGVAANRQRASKPRKVRGARRFFENLKCAHHAQLSPRASGLRAAEVRDPHAFDTAITA